VKKRTPKEKPKEKREHPRTLTARQQLFCAKYLECMVAGEAYRHAYPTASAATAETNGPALLRRAQVQAYLQPKLAKRVQKLELKAEILDEHLAAAASFDPGTMYDSKGNILAVKDMPEATRRALVGLDQEELFEGRGDDRELVGIVKKVKWHDKVAAMRLAYQRLGLLKDRLDVNLQGQVELKEVSAEEWEALSQLRHQVRGKAGAKER